jgi:Glycosyl hydrolase catalytic core
LRFACLGLGWRILACSHPIDCIVGKELFMNIHRIGSLVALAFLVANSSPSMGADVYRQASAPTPQLISKAFFGVHVLYLVPRQGRTTAWPDAPVGSIRLYDSALRWADIEPQPERWQFDRLDAYVNLAEKQGAEIDYVLGSPPAWASARPTEKCPYGLGCAAEPADMSIWENYVRKLARRYKGRISVYELGNEPKFYSSPEKYPGGFFSGSVEKMVEMGRIAQKVLREEDPHARLASPGFDGGARWLEMFLAAGGKSVIDILAYHFYAPDVPGFTQQVVTVRDAMARQGIASMPLWNTESGFEVDEPGARSLPYKRITRDEQAAAISQTMVIAAAAGIERFFVYAWDHVSMGMVNAADSPYPAYAAASQTATWLEGATMLGCHQDDAGIVACDGKRDSGSFTIAWSNTGRPLTPAPPSGTRLGSREDLVVPHTSSVPTVFRWVPAR